MYLIILKHFLSFSTMPAHAQACVGWSKYTTDNTDFSLSRIKNNFWFVLKKTSRHETNKLNYFSKLFWKKVKERSSYRFNCSNSYSSLKPDFTQSLSALIFIKFFLPDCDKKINLNQGALIWQKRSFGRVVLLTSFLSR